MSSCLVPIKGLGRHARLQRRWRSAGSGRYAMTSIANFAPLCASPGHSAMPTRPQFRRLQGASPPRNHKAQRIPTPAGSAGPSGHGCQPRAHGWAVTRPGCYISILENWALREWGARRRPFRFAVAWKCYWVIPSRAPAMRFVLGIATTNNQPPCDCYKRLAIQSYNWSGLYQQRSPSRPCYIVRHNNNFYMRCSLPLDSRPAL
jgi:hypothetical protein